MSYYYTCGVDPVAKIGHCIRSEDGFKDFENPRKYSKMTRLILSKEEANKDIVTGYTATVLLFTTTVKYELQILWRELDVPMVIIDTK